MTTALIEAMKHRLVAAELAQLGITDRAQVIAVAARTRVEDSGALVGLDANGNPGVGTGPNYTLSVADVARELGATTTETRAPTAKAESKVVTDPTAKDFNFTRAIVAARSDPDLHRELMARLAPKTLRL